MSSSRRKFSVRHPVVVDIGCSCRRPKLPSFFSSVPKPKPPKTPCYFSPSTTTTATTTSASHWDSSLAATNSSPSRYDYSSSPALLTPQSPRRKPKASRAQRKPTTKKENRITTTTTTTTAAKSETKKTKTKKKAVVEESVAVVKESSDPYVDFKESMLQMIVEMEIYAWDDLRDLLHRFLSLNSPYHHHLILQAFAEIWNALFSSSAAVGDASTSGHRRRR